MAPTLTFFRLVFLLSSGVAGCSHDLIRTIILTAPSIAAAWHGLLNCGRSTKKQADGSDVASLKAIVAMHDVGKIDEVFSTPTWIYPPLSRRSHDVAALRENSHNSRQHQENFLDLLHKYDMNRVQEDLSSTFGADSLSTPREWNEEVQAVRLMPTSSTEEKLLRYRYINKIMAEFVDACKAAAIAVLDGHFTPLNAMDPPGSHVFIYNNIFFSHAIDSKESFKLCEGDEACRKYAGLDLKNQRIIQSIGVEGLHTGISAIVDFRGSRIMAQTVIPGILSQTERTSRLMYGCLEHGKKISCKQSALKVLTEVAEKLNLVTRLVHEVPTPLPAIDKADVYDIPLADSQSIRIDDEDETPAVLLRSDTFEVVTDAKEIGDVAVIRAIPHIGPVEGKLIEGSDKRIYILEFMRLTPRDANYVQGPKGTKCVNDKVLTAAGTWFPSPFICLI